MLVWWKFSGMPLEITLDFRKVSLSKLSFAVEAILATLP